MSIRTVVMSVVALMVLVLQGCTAMPDDRVIQDAIVANEVEQDNRFYMNTKVGQADGFEGTSMLFNASPDMNNRTALENLKEALRKNSLYNENGEYTVDIIVRDNGACDKGLSLTVQCEGGGYTYIKKDVDVDYIVKKGNEVVAEFNVVTSGRGETGFLVYWKEKKATEQAYARNLNDFIERLTELD